MRFFQFSYYLDFFLFLKIIGLEEGYFISGLGWMTVTANFFDLIGTTTSMQSSQREPTWNDRSFADSLVLVSLIVCNGSCLSIAASPWNGLSEVSCINLSSSHLPRPYGVGHLSTLELIGQCIQRVHGRYRHLQRMMHCGRLVEPHSIFPFSFASLVAPYR